MKTRTLSLAIAIALSSLTGVAYAAQTNFGPNGFNFGVQPSPNKPSNRPVASFYCHTAKEHASVCKDEKCCRTVPTSVQSKNTSGMNSTSQICLKGCPMMAKQQNKTKGSH